MHYEQIIDNFQRYTYAPVWVYLAYRRELEAES